MKECPRCRRCLEDMHSICPDDGAPLETGFVGPCTLDERYRLLRRVGGGGMGRVYQAHHLHLRRRVSIKLLHPRFSDDPRLIAQFEREAEALGRLDHPGIVRVSDFGIDAARGLPYLVMEYLEGVSLAQRLEAGGTLPIETALPIFDQMAAAIDSAHDAGILHCDLKPSNVFLTHNGGKIPRIKVVDFGLTRFLHDPEATTVFADGTGQDPAGAREDPAAKGAALMGTPGYLAPEVLAGRQPTPAADLYSFAMLVYATLAGQPPSVLTTTQAARSRPRDRVPKLRDSDIGKAIRACIVQDPHERPKSARRMVAGLRKAARRHQVRREIRYRLALSCTVWLAALLGTVALPLRGLENRLVDARFYLAAAKPPSHPLLLVLVDDDTLADDPAPLVDKSHEMGRLLRRVLEQGAAGVAVDILLPEPWGASEDFSQLVLRHADRLALAAYSPPEGPVIGPAALNGFTVAALGAQRSQEIFGYVNLGEDQDGVVRRGRTGFRDVHGRWRSTFAARIVKIWNDAERPPGERWFPIDFTCDWRQLEKVSWRHLSTLLEEEPERLRDRFVLVGATYSVSNNGLFRVPHPRELPGEIPGPILQALIVHTLLEELPVREIPRSFTLAASGLGVMVVAGAALLARRFFPAVAASLVLILVWIAAAGVGFVHGRLLLDVTFFCCSLLLTLALATVLRGTAVRGRRTSVHEDIGEMACAPA